MRLLDVLKRKPKTEIFHGVVLQVNAEDAKVKIILNNGMKIWVRYGTTIQEPFIGDKLLLGGDITKFVVQAVDRSIPKDTSILLV